MSAFAQLNPLFPLSPPTRASASSAVLQVRTPKITGRLWSSATR